MTLDERNGMLQIISDLSKEAYGYRVRLDYNAMSDEELQNTWDGFCDTAEERQKEEESMEARAWDEFTKHIADMQEVAPTASVADIIRWDMDAYDVMQEGIDGVLRPDIGFYCYKRGIAYRKEQEIQTMLA